MVLGAPVAQLVPKMRGSVLLWHINTLKEGAEATLPIFWSGEQFQATIEGQVVSQVHQLLEVCQVICQSLGFTHSSQLLLCFRLNTLLDRRPSYIHWFLGSTPGRPSLLFGRFPTGPRLVSFGLNRGSVKQLYLLSILDPDQPAYQFGRRGTPCA